MAKCADDAICQRCICFAAGTRFAPAEPSDDPCPICLEVVESRYTLPQCTHSFCGPCMGRVLFRDLPTSGATDCAIVSAAFDPVLFTNSQPCPVCRRPDARGPWQRHRAICEARLPGPDEAWAVDVRRVMAMCAVRAASATLLGNHNHRVAVQPDSHSVDVGGV